jgi:hypothetical protein
VGRETGRRGSGDSSTESNFILTAAIFSGSGGVVTVAGADEGVDGIVSGSANVWPSVIPAGTRGAGTSVGEGAGTGTGTTAMGGTPV